MNDKELEKERYNYSSKIIIEESNLNLLNCLGSDNYELYLREPYIQFHRLIQIEAQKKPSINHLDLCCGDGLHSFTAAKYGANVTAIDYSENSIFLAKKRAEIVGLNINFQIGDVEKLPFLDETFDLITCAGSLSYLDHSIFIKEVKRVLKRDGTFIVVDSFNHNLIYRVNRFFHYLKGERSYSTLKRIPNFKLIKFINYNFSNFNIHYYGIFIFLVPVLKLFFKPNRVKIIITTLDHYFYFLRVFSFKIVFKASKKIIL